jgi:hypothetical protein
LIVIFSLSGIVREVYNRPVGRFQRFAAECRPKRRMDRLSSDLRSAMRALRRRPAATLAIVLTLALGIGANTAVFSVVAAVLLPSLPYPHPERLVRLWESGPRGDQRNVSEANYNDWMEQSKSFEAMSTFIVQDMWPSSAPRCGRPCVRWRGWRASQPAGC